ncbi:MAG: hypothetical protein ACD_75C00814G0001 [uncultured bacterium]|nr:MAG: hypothetical protein ACD_75C00814G0001 [uncultured bacterium]
MVGDDLLHCPCRQAVTGDIDNVVHPAHDVHIAILVDISTVAGLVVAGEFRHIGLDETLVIAPESSQGARRQGQFHDDIALGAFRHDFVIVVHHPHVIAGHGFGGRAFLHRQQLDATAIADNGPAGFGLPPVIDDRHADHVFGPMQGVGIGTFACKIEAFKRGNVIFLNKLAFGILFLDRPEGSRSGKERFYFMLGNDPPECAGIWSPDRFSFIENRSGTLKQRSIHNI